MVISRDYGAIGNAELPSNSFELIERTQVWNATHNSEGSLLPSLRRSFISFSFGGKNIEDFNLIAVTDGDRMSRNGYSNFTDLTTDYDILDGQFYNGTHFNPYELSLTLATDGIDQKKLDEFLHWFRGGITRELILAEHPNRAIMARVAAPPALEVLPFEKPIQVNIGAMTYNTSTTLYKGIIKLDFISESSFWYAKTNLFMLKNGNDIISNVNIASKDQQQDMLKIIYEDNVPTADLVMSTMHFGGDYYALVGGSEAFSCIAGPIDTENPTTKPDNWDNLALNIGYFTWDVVVDGHKQEQYWKGARIWKDVILGRIAGTTVDNESNVISEVYTSTGEPYNFFYGGTAPSPVTISFAMPLKPVDISQLYLDGIANSYASNGTDQYSSITVKSVHTKKFSFTTPNIMTSYNKLVYILCNEDEDNRQVVPGETFWGDISDTLRDQIRHPVIREWGVQMINYLQSETVNANNTYITENGNITQNFINFCHDNLPKLFINENGSWSNAIFEFNTELGTAKGTFSYWKATASNINIVDAVVNNKQQKQFVTVTEDVGDMLRSNWLVLEDQNILNNGYINLWSENAKTNAHQISHDMKAPITNLRVLYKNMYL